MKSSPVITLVCPKCYARLVVHRSDLAPPDATEQHQPCPDCSDSSTAGDDPIYYNYFGMRVFTTTSAYRKLP